MAGERNTAGLRASSTARTRNADEQILDAFRTMLREGTPITVTRVAKRAGVHRSTVGKRPEVMRQINAAKASSGASAPARTAATAESVKSINAALQAENRRLRRELRAAEARIGDLLAEQRLTSNLLPHPTVSQNHNQHAKGIS
ncbi:DUF6262 family protein [uncultured Nocardioides sp.]|uniref:DUF6262 family protein n=1 Tax=uncultured Nocardioides sp. TaxID=198441 RepID=UPI00262D737E|nr:DUF6262 family protein [uncultured Nocardioides sp.]